MQKDALVTKIARWILDLYHLRFDKIGSLHLSTDQNTVTVGPISTDVWNIDGRARIEDIDRGPWSTARDYFKACAQRELDCLKPLLTQEASEGYKRTVEENRAQVEYSMWLMTRIIGDCEGLDDDDPSFAPFAVDSRAFEPETIFVSREDFSKIVSRHYPSYLVVLLVSHHPSASRRRVAQYHHPPFMALCPSSLLVKKQSLRGRRCFGQKVAREGFPENCLRPRPQFCTWTRSWRNSTKFGRGLQL